ncbi:dTDP-4-dehydrorhamnose reductase [Treponema primitia]|uniref:dTDP-4-dehydrorhamnose reductase n=1 Tax=Treponema primitia TaxID=88058 RepID=UPI0039806316
MIWIIGNRGMLGRELSVTLERHGLEYIGTGREVDITNPDALSAFVENQKAPFKWIVNCSAYTAVDKAEDDAVICRKLNIDGSGNIAKVAKKIGANLIYISTDYVFDGKGIIGSFGVRPYKEEDHTSPNGVYAQSKRDGENRVLQENDRSYIIRTAWLYGKYRKNFVYTMLSLMKEKDMISVVNDQRGSPTWTYDLAETITAFIKKAGTVSFGLYHYTNEGNITWFDFAQEIYAKGKRLGILTKNCMVSPCTSVEFPTRAKRPAYSVLDKTKVKKTLGIDIPDWNISLGEFLKICEV